MTVPEETPPAGRPLRPPRSAARSRRGLLIGGVSVLLLGVAWAGSTLYTAGQAQMIGDTLASSLDGVLKSNHLGRVERHRYSRGLTSSTDDLYVVLNDTAPLKLHLRNHVQNGPLPGLSRVARAVIDTEMIWDDPAVQAAVDRAFSGEKPVLRTVIGLDGGAETTVQVPSGQYQQDGSTAHWQPLNGRFQIGSGGRGVSGTLDWPGASAGDAATGTTELKNIRFVVAQQPYLTHLTQGRTSFSVGSVTLPQGAGQLNGLSVVTTTTPSGQNLESRTQLAAEALQVAGQTWSHPNLILSADGMNSAALEALSGVLQKPEYQTLTGQVNGSQVDDTTVNRLLTELTPGLKQLLAGNPSLRVDEISVELPQGRLKASLGAQVIDGSRIDLKTLLSGQSLAAGTSNPALLGLLGNLKLSADIEGNQTAVEALLGESGNETAAGIGQSIAPMIEQGMITRTGDLLRTHLEFGKEGASINGKPVPLQ